MFKTLSYPSPGGWVSTSVDSTTEFSWTRHGFGICILFIMAVSVYDSFLVVWYRDMILDDERNPICELLIRRDPNHLSWFLAGKFFGNVVVISTLMGLRWIGYQRTMTIAIGVAIFQLALLTFLTFSDPLTGFLHFDGLLSNDPEEFANTAISLMVHLTALLAGYLGWIAWKLKWKSIRNHSPQEPIAV